MNRSPLDPYNMKTLGQYNLLGDPSITVSVPKAAARVTRELKQRKARSKSLVVPSMSASSDPGGYNRALRRYRLGELGLALGAAAQVARPASNPAPSVVASRTGEISTGLPTASARALTKVGLAAQSVGGTATTPRTDWVFPPSK